MEVKTFYFNATDGWSCEQFPDMDSENTVVLFFAAKEYMNKKTPIQELTAFYQQAKILGCSTAGEIYQNQVFDDSIVVAVLQAQDTKVKIIHELIDKNTDSKAVGHKVVDTLLLNDLDYIFLLSDGIAVNGSLLIDGMTENLSKFLPISGGLAGDGDRFEKTWTYSKERGFCTSGVVAIGFYGKKLFPSYGSGGGWDTFGPERIITKAKDNILFEIDDQPALPLYKRYLGDHANRLPGSALLFPMAIREANGNKGKIVRTILGINEKDQSLTFAGNMPQGWYAQLMTSTDDHLFDGALTAGQQALDNNKNMLGSQMLSIAISCVGRRMVLSENTDEELEVLLSLYPKNTLQIGFYSYGELSPSGMKQCDLHNQTMTVTILQTNGKQAPTKDS